MNFTAILIGMGMLGISILVIIRPFQQKQTKGVKKSMTLVQNEEDRVAALSALRDLDFDHKIGKVIDEDYVPARAQLLAKAAQYIKQQEEEKDKLEALIQARRASRDSKCEKCGTTLEMGQGFCSKCGAPVNSAACPSCGKKVRTGDLFCSSCGSRVEIQMEAIAQS
jgi:DNA-directed RNA polymerase subunit RPC12/RpoP